MTAPRRSGPRILVTMAAGVAFPLCLYACAARMAPPAPPPLVMPADAQVIHPVAVPTPVSHEVKASWYGPGMAGRKTTSGERFNPKALTAASKSLPIGSVVKVTNPENGKSVNVRINDRGPFVPGRSLDLSQRAAEKIGIIHKGVARINVCRPAVPAQKSAATPVELDGDAPPAELEDASDHTEPKPGK